jgi:hypothetical protein
MREVLVSNLGRTAAILTEVFRDLPLSLQANAGIVHRLDYDRSLPYPFKVIFSPSVLPQELRC